MLLQVSLRFISIPYVNHNRYYMHKCTHMQGRIVEEFLSYSGCHHAPGVGRIRRYGVGGTGAFQPSTPLLGAQSPPGALGNVGGDQQVWRGVGKDQSCINPSSWIWRINGSIPDRSRRSRWWINWRGGCWCA